MKKVKLKTTQKVTHIKRTRWADTSVGFNGDKAVCIYVDIDIDIDERKRRVREDLKNGLI